jgi:hypothetical protein
MTNQVRIIGHRCYFGSISRLINLAEFSSEDDQINNYGQA